MHELWVAAIVAITLGAFAGALCWLLLRAAAPGDRAAERAAESWARAAEGWERAEQAWKDTRDSMEDKQQ